VVNLSVSILSSRTITYFQIVVKVQSKKKKRVHPKILYLGYFLSVIMFSSYIRKIKLMEVMEVLDIKIAALRGCQLLRM
jgi:hypothetical protein